MREAMYWTKLEDGKVRCDLCPHKCILKEGEIGICEGKKNIGGKLIAVNYGETVSLAMDPIEKKPLFHFYPGSYILSTAPNGCNLRCPYCQNYEISIAKADTTYISPEKLVDLAVYYKSRGIAFTYSEPLIWYEYIYDTAPIAKKHNLKIVLVTNGTIEEAPLRELLKWVDAMNIDLKSMDEKYYRTVLKGNLETVKNTIQIASKSIHIEVTNLLIPGVNDTKEQIQELIEWVAGVNDRIPLHFTRYFPHYKYVKAPTPVETLKMAYEMGRKYLKYVYMGNVYTGEGENTYCPVCGNLLVKRVGYQVNTSGIKKKRCSKCGNPVDFVL